MSSVLPPPGWISLPASHIGETGTLWLREPAGRNRQLLLHQLREDIYPHPFIIDDGKTRRLHFNRKLLQSEMSLGQPDELALAYARTVMTFPMFVPHPEHVVIVGLGGGSLTKCCHRSLENCRVTTVEISEAVIACRDWFLLPPDDARLRILQADAAEYFAGPADAADVVILDAYDEDGIAPQLGERTFFENLQRHLKPHGMLVVNISGHSRTAEDFVDLIADVFSQRCGEVDVPRDDNRIVFAFRDAAFPPNWRQIEKTAGMLASRYPYDFLHALHELERSLQRRRRKRQHKV